MGRGIESGGARRWSIWITRVDYLVLGRDDTTPDAVLVETLVCRAGLIEMKVQARYLRWRVVEVNGRNYVDSAGETERYSASWNASDDGPSLLQTTVLTKLPVALTSELANLGSWS